MVIIVDTNGQEHDLQPYKEKLITPPEQKIRIRRWVEAKEKELSIIDPKSFKKRMTGFLRRYTYTENILDILYQPMENTGNNTTVSVREAY